MARSSLCANIAGVGRSTARRSVSGPGGGGVIGKLSDATARPPKAVKRIVRANVAAACTGAKKPWLITLLHGCLPDLYCFMRQPSVATFAGVAAFSWRPFHAEAMPRGLMGSIDANEERRRMKKMIPKRVLNAQRVRRISGSFAFLEHRFLGDGFLSSLSHRELILYVFLVLAADRLGLSYYSYDRICEVLKLDLNDYLAARDGLLDKDLIGFDGVIFQVFSLPAKPVSVRHPQDEHPRGCVPIGQLFRKMLEGRS